MQVSNSYYEDEVRDGFYVPGMMKRAWAASVEVYEDVARICEKHKIQYFADAGTLLGAVRHQGYIPWDDDFDICMKREDYNRFISIAQEELQEGYSLLNIHTEPDYDEMFSRVVNRTQICFEQEHLNKFHGFPFVVGIDIFPLDYIAPSEEEEQFRCQLVEIVYGIQSAVAASNDSAETDALIGQVEQLCGVQIDRNGNICNQLFLLLERLFTLYSSQEASDLALMPIWVERGTNRFKKEYYRETIKMPFENIEIPVPAMYDAVLKEKYGDYSRLVHNWDTHDYPFYGEQMKILEKKTGFRYPKYVFAMEDLQRNNPDKQDDGKERKEVVFLPYKASMWHSMESYWKAAQEDPDCDVYVIPIPYYDRNLDNSLHEIHYEGNLYPEDVPVVWYEDYDFANRRPDVIYIQNPYDEYNQSTSVLPFFYTKNLKQFTERLIYVSPFVLTEIQPEDKRAVESMEYFVKVPGVVQADQVIVQSEAMRKSYIDALAEFAGEQTRSIWEKKIVAQDVSKNVGGEVAEKEKLQIPGEWLSVIRKEDGSFKKVIMYNIGVSTLLQYGDKMLEKMRSVFDTFKKRKDEVALLWKPYPVEATPVERICPDLWEKYQKLVEEYQSEGWGIYDDSDEMGMSIAVCDAYYGDRSSMVRLFCAAGKPVMLQNVDIL
ncbi:MAG: phosphorylcholine transferase LicD [Roseburia sp.]